MPARIFRTATRFHSSRKASRDTLLLRARLGTHPRAGRGRVSLLAFLLYCTGSDCSAYGVTVAGVQVATPGKA
jgi:hypothetical protein